MQLKAGAKRDGYFDNDDLVAQVEISMDIIEEKTHDLNVPSFYLIMPLAIKNGHLMHQLLEKWF